MTDRGLREEYSPQIRRRRVREGVPLQRAVSRTNNCSRIADCESDASPSRREGVQVACPRRRVPRNPILAPIAAVKNAPQTADDPAGGRVQEEDGFEGNIGVGGDIHPAPRGAGIGGTQGSPDAGTTWSRIDR